MAWAAPSLVDARSRQRHRHQRRQLYGASRAAANGGGVDGGDVLIVNVRRTCAVAMIVAALVLMWPASAPHAQGGPALNVCHAGSLTAAFTPLEDAFHRLYPEVTVVDTVGGSVDLARRHASGMLNCDIYA